MLPATVKAVLDWFTAKTDQRQAAPKLRDERRELIAKWRTGLAESHTAYWQWLVANYKEAPSRTIIVSPLPDPTGFLVGVPFDALLTGVAAPIITAMSVRASDARKADQQRQMHALKAEQEEKMQARKEQRQDKLREQEILSTAAMDFVEASTEILVVSVDKGIFNNVDCSAR